jgi:tetratricopeptide (TPR) repeat protein
MDMANALFKLGQKDKAFSLLESVVKNNHENLGVINMVEAVFESANMGAEGRELIKKSTTEVVNINNQGVMLANEGRFEDGIKLMRQAVQTLPNNDLMIANLCGMMIGLMTRSGKDDRLIFEARELLDRVRNINPNNKKYSAYMSLLNKLATTPA